MVLLGASCSSLYYASMEKLGKEKRDILVSRVKDVREDQEKAKEQFQTTLEAFQAVTGFEGGDLEKTYKKLSSELEDAESRAKKVQDRIDSVEKVAKDLFVEWEGEISTIQDASLRSKSRNLLQDTRRRYAGLIAKMRAAEKRMVPVLAAFRDQVLFLKHNLNARAIQSLKDTSVQIDGEVSRLVKDLELSIQEADSFIASMSSSS
jgi:predicted  nucleic acid-binding Zn-ribbon protein